MGTSTEAVRWLASMGERYVDAYVAAHREDLDRLREDRYFGLAWFFYGFAFERNGAPRGYKLAAVKAVRHLEETKSDLTQLSKVFGELYRGKPNKRNNAVFDVRIGDFDVPSIVKLVERGDISEAYSSISLRGIGPKIKALFLREIVTITGSESRMANSAESYLYCQPIDVWVRTTIQALCPKVPSTPPNVKIGTARHDLQAAWELTQIALGAEVSPLRLNQGIWYYCSNVVGDSGRLKSLFQPLDRQRLEKELNLMDGFLPVRPPVGWLD